jgi:hypothetical protein
MAAVAPGSTFFGEATMPVRRLHNLLRRVANSGAERGQRVFAAFLLGSAISVAGLAAIAANPSAAHGPFTAANPTFLPLAGQPTYSIVPVESRAHGDGEGRRREHISVVSGHSESHSSRSYGGGEPVCVRLCDGFFFPLSAAAGDVASQGAACNSLCPDAPTEVYYRNGADTIEGAVSTHGRLYSALPVSLRYRGTSDNTCTCHRDVVAYAPLRDATLKRGDAVMTPAGFMVFRGAEAASHGPSDFTALGGAGLSAGARGALQAMERASLTPTHPTLKDWLVSQVAPAPGIAARSLVRAERGDNRIRVMVWRGPQD